MSNYGFATYDDKTKSLLGSVNSKWPIFGPEYNSISKCFKTIHLSDITEQNYITGNPSTPTGLNYDYWGIDSGKSKQLIFQIEHGFNFRPIGYAFFNGDVKRTSKIQVSQSEVIGSGWSAGEFGGNFTLSGQGSDSVLARPDIVSQIIEGEDTGDFTFFNFDYVIVGDSSTEYTPTLRIPNNCLGIFKTFYSLISGDKNVPYSVEIDGKYVKIYRYIDWIDYKGRYRYISSYSSTYDYDINQRIKAITSYSGTELDCTVYLCPYSMEDLT